MSSTDRATCKLTCDGNADVCSDDCRAREKTCNAAPLTTIRDLAGE
jgi:hypothetical protein